MPKLGKRRRCNNVCVYLIIMHIYMNIYLSRSSWSILPPHVYMISNNNQGSAFTGVTPQPQHLELGLAHKMHWICRTKRLQKQTKKKLSVQRRANNTDRLMEKSHETNQGLIRLRIREVILKTIRFPSPFQTPWRRQIRRAPSSRSQGAVCETSKWLFSSPSLGVTWCF